MTQHGKLKQGLSFFSVVWFGYLSKWVYVFCKVFSHFVGSQANPFWPLPAWQNNTVASSHLISVSRISPGRCGVTLAVMVKRIKVGGRSILSVEVSCGNCWSYPLVVCEKCYQRLPAGFSIVTVCPVSVHEPLKNTLKISSLYISQL